MMKKEFRWIRRALCYLLALLAGAGICMSAFGILLSPESGIVEQSVRTQFEQVLKNRALTLGEELAMRHNQKHTPVAADFYRQYVFPGHGKQPAINSSFHTGIGPAMLDSGCFDYVLCADGQTIRNTLRHGFPDYDYHFAVELTLPMVRVVEMPILCPELEYEKYLRLKQQEPERLAKEFPTFPLVGPDVEHFSYVKRTDGRGQEHVLRVDRFGTTDYDVSIALTRRQAEMLVGSMPRRNDPVRLLSGCSMEFWVLSLVLYAAELVLALWLLGRRAGVGADGEIRAAGFNRLPLEAAAFMTWLVFGLPGTGGALDPWRVTDQLLKCTTPEALTLLGSVMNRYGKEALGAAVLLTALCAQYREGIWWENSLCCRAIRLAREKHLKEKLRELYDAMNADDDEDLDEDLDGEFEEASDPEESDGTERARVKTFFRNPLVDRDEDEDYVDVDENEPDEPET